MINTNLPPILHRFQVMADYSQIFASERECLSLLLSLGAILCQYYIAINNISLKLHCLACISAAESIRISSTTFTQSAQKSTEFGEITQSLGLFRRSRSFKVTEFGTGSNRKLICDFLLVINKFNSNLPPILHRFRDIASERSTRSSSGDEIANVNFLYDDIVHVIQNTIDSCINSATAVMCWNVCLPNSVK